jgi:hypothetical protein
MTRRAPGVIALLLLLPLAACASEDDPSSSGETSEAAPDPEESPEESPEQSPEQSPEDEAAGGEVEGDGYSFDGPEGWEDATERFAAMTPGVDRGLLDMQGENPVFADNVNVIVGAPYPAFSPEEAEQRFLEELRGFAKQARVLPRVEIADKGAVHLSAMTPIGKIEVFTEQYAAYVDETWYIVTFSHGPDTAAADREDDISLVLDSWEWSEGEGA